MNNLKDNQLSKKAMLVVVGALIILLLLIASSYAYYNINSGNSSASTKGTINLECVDITYVEEGQINLDKAYPVTDAYALKNGTPVTVKIKNNCTENLDNLNYSLVLTTLKENSNENYITSDKIRLNSEMGTKTSSMTDSELKASLTSIYEKPTYLNDLDAVTDSYLVNALNQDITNRKNTEDNLMFENYTIVDSYIIDENSVANNNENVYEIKIWLDYYEGDKEVYTNKDYKHNSEYDNSTKNKTYTGVLSLVVNPNVVEKKFTEGTAEELVQLAISKKEPLKGLNNAAEGGMYRYQGSCSSGEACAGVVDNYICFGTTSKEECLANTDQYMYRIIGIDSTTKELKLIKKESLNAAVQWYYQDNGDTDTELSEINWLKSDIVQRLNGYTKSYDNARELTALFVDSGSAYPYMSKTGYNGINWYNMISPHQWYYGDVNDNNSGALEIYEIETGQRGATWNDPSTGEPSEYTTNKLWTQMTEAEANKYKIGLMQQHDYYYSQKSGGNNCSSYSRPSICKTSWMNLSKNDAKGLDGIIVAPPNEAEWIMERRGRDNSFDNSFYAWRVAMDGGLHNDGLSIEYSARPVFYLNSSVEIKGDGTFANPYTIINVG